MNDFLDLPGGARDEDESPFARDIDGFLVRLDQPTAADLDTDVNLTIDGHQVTIKKAALTLDPLGHPIYRDGHTVLRANTIYDAAVQEFGCGDANPIPVLCHQPHQRPVAVCRVCSVFITRATDKRRPRKLLPACQHRVEEGMIVYTGNYQGTHAYDGRTMEPGAVVRRTVETLLELLVTDHLPGYQPGGTPGANELIALANRLRVPAPRFPPSSPARPTDVGSEVIAVNHAACILCDRCVRGCNEVRQNFVIGRNGKGYETRIGFDLGGGISESDCVKCGECMISCPTDALTARATVRQTPGERPGEVVGPVPIEELLRPPLDELFGALPRKFLEWNAGAIVRRRLQAREEIAREREYGSHAFLLEEGTLMSRIKASPLHLRNKRPTGWLSRMLGHSVLHALSRVEAGHGATRTASIRTDVSGMSVSLERPEFQITARRGQPNLRLIGETACLNNYPYAATIMAVEPSVVLEIRRNVLLQMLRAPQTRRRLDEFFRQEALEPFLLRLPLLAALGLPARRRVSQRVAPAVKFRRVDPGQTIYAQGDPADHCYLVRVGFVRVSQRQGGQDVVLNYVGPGGFFGDEELLEAVTGRPAPRVATCQALDHVEVVRIPGDVLAAIVRSDDEVRARLLEAADGRRRRYDRERARAAAPLGDFLERGLYHARSLLVLDLDKCTRCDECTKACADTHDGVSHLLREGLRFGNYLVTTSCRSCLVDAIHRSRNRREIVIEDWCIGCTLCARSCPYGNIQMAEVRPGGGAEPKVQATTCDLCRHLSPDADPSCVFACPHDAAHRMNGRELFKRVAPEAPEGGPPEPQR